MTSRPVRTKVRRRTAEERRAEILNAARCIALQDGFQAITLRAVALRLEITDGLVGHYFPVLDSLLAEAFGTLAADELHEVQIHVDECDDPIRAVRRLLELLVINDRSLMNVLWLDAWHAGRRRPALMAEVAQQTSAWLDWVTALIEAGRDKGVFTTERPRTAANRILGIVDGVSVQAAMRGSHGSDEASDVDYETLKELVVIVAERELGLPPGSLF